VIVAIIGVETFYGKVAGRYRVFDALTTLAFDYPRRADYFREELKQKARTEAAVIVKNAERQIELETSRALQQIRHEAVDISVAIASKLLQKNVTREDNERLIEDTFKQLEARRPS